MAHLKACGEWRLSELDQSHPVIASATLAEITAAIQEAARFLRCPLENKVERWMSGGSELTFGLGACWQPLREARHQNLRHCVIRSGFTILVFNAIEVFQVSYRAGSPTTLLHVQPLSAPEAAGYYNMHRTLGRYDFKRLEAPIHSDFTPTRGPSGAMSADMVNIARQHTNLSDIPEWEMPLFQYISTQI